MKTRSNPLPPRVLLSVVALALAAGGFGCAFGEIRPDDPFDRELTLSRAQHRYTVLMRWSEFQKAKKFVAEEDREVFKKQTRLLKDARFTGYESEEVELDDEMESATVEVIYTLYTPAIPYEIEITETQEWTRNGLGNNWKVYSVFDGLPGLAAN